MKHIIIVTQDDIDNGADCSACNCPIARAIQRIPGCEGALIRSKFWQKASGEPAHPLPSEAVEFISDFDDHRQVLPFEFEIDIAP